MAYKGYPWPGEPDSWVKFDDVSIGLLRRIVEKTEARVVLSSTWRIGMSKPEMDALARKLGVSIIGATRQAFGSEVRGEQIKEWLDAHAGQIDAYIIIDDNSDMLDEQMERFVKTPYTDGLTYQNHVDAISLLGGKA